MKRFRIAMVLTAATLAAAPAHAALTSVRVVERDVLARPAGSVVNGIEIDFSGELGELEMLVELQSGSVYNDGFGTATPPSGALFAVAPSEEADSYVALGGYTRSVPSAHGILVVRESGLLDPSPDFVDVAWRPYRDTAFQVVINGGSDFPIAQLTLSGDAQGSIRLSVEAGGRTVVLPTGEIRDGVVYLAIPEPGSAVIALAGLLLSIHQRRTPTVWRQTVSLS